MKSRTCAVALRWMFVCVVAVLPAFARHGSAVAEGVGAAGQATSTTIPISIPCAGTITTAYDAEGVARPVCVTPSPESPEPTSQLVGTAEDNISGVVPGEGKDTQFGIAVGAVLVVACGATSLVVRRRKP